MNYLFFTILFIFIFLKRCYIVEAVVVDTRAVSHLEDWNEAMNVIFDLDSGSSPVSNYETCNNNIKDLLIRQRMLLNITLIKEASPQKLYELSILAGLAGISPWKRDKLTNKIQITDYGYPIHPSSPTNVESDVMTCIICALLIVIATFHLMYIMNNNSNQQTANNPNNAK